MKTRIHQPLRSWPWSLRRNFFKGLVSRGQRGGADWRGEGMAVNRPEVAMPVVMLKGAHVPAHAGHHPGNLGFVKASWKGRAVLRAHLGLFGSGDAYFVDASAANPDTKSPPNRPCQNSISAGRCSRGRRRLASGVEATICGRATLSAPPQRARHPRRCRGP